MIDISALSHFVGQQVKFTSDKCGQVYARLLSYNDQHIQVELSKGFMAKYRTWNAGDIRLFDLDKIHDMELFGGVPINDIHPYESMRTRHRGIALIERYKSQAERQRLREEIAAEAKEKRNQQILAAREQRRIEKFHENERIRQDNIRKKNNLLKEIKVRNSRKRNN